jgi:hypothetical protein
MEHLYRIEFRMLNPALRIVRIRTVIENRLETWSNALAKQYETQLIRDYRGKDLELAKRMAVSQRLLPLRLQMRQMLDVDALSLYAKAAQALPDDLAQAAAENAQARIIWWEDAPCISWIMLRQGFIAPDRRSITC